jgi:autotransporter-associated beta strand protein
MSMSTKSLDRTFLLAALLVGCCASSALAGGYNEAVMSANPTAYFQLNDTSGATAANTVASPAVTGTYFNSWGTAGTATTMLSGGTASTGSPAPTLMQAGSSLPGFASGNYSVFFEGRSSANTDSDSLRISAPTATFGNDYTMQFWFMNTRPVSSTTITGYLGQRVGDNVIGIWGNHWGSGGTSADAGEVFSIATGGNATFGTGFLTSTNTWYNAAVTRSGNTQSVYINGGLVISTTAAMSATSQDFLFGLRNDGGWGFQGNLDSISLTNRALSAAEVLSTYNAAVAPQVYWSGSSGLWTTGSAWSTASGSFAAATAGAGGGQDAIFNLAESQTTRLNGDQRVNSLTFSSAGSTLLLGGSTGANAANSLQLGTVLNSGSIAINSGAGAVTIGDTSGSAAAVNLLLAGNQTWSNNSANTFTVANAVAGSAASGTQSLTVNGSGVTSILGAITNGTAGGTLGLVKAGAGTLTLSAANSYTGATSVEQGSLLVNGQLNASAVTVRSGGLLGGSGTLGNVNVLAGGTFSPGNSPGLISLSQLALAGTTLMEIDGLVRGTQYDAVDISGLITYGGSMVIDFGSSITSAFADNTTFNLFAFGSYSGQFSGITTANDGSWYGGLTFVNSGDNNKWTAGKGSQTLEFTHSTGALVIVPEPGALALAGIGIAAAAYALRSRSPSRKRVG